MPYLPNTIDILESREDMAGIFWGEIARFCEPYPGVIVGLRTLFEVDLRAELSSAQFNGNVRMWLPC